jgi:hypothetical protein
MHTEMTEKQICDLLDKDCSTPMAQPPLVRCYLRQAYGQWRIYAENGGYWLYDLLGQQTITPRQIGALKKIGVRFSLERHRDAPAELAQLFDEQH